MYNITVYSKRDNSTHACIYWTTVHRKNQHALEKFIAQNWIQHYNTYVTQPGKLLTVITSYRDTYGTLVALSPPNNLVSVLCFIGSHSPLNVWFCLRLLMSW